MEKLSSAFSNSPQIGLLLKFRTGREEIGTPNLDMLFCGKSTRAKSCSQTEIPA